MFIGGGRFFFFLAQHTHATMDNNRAKPTTPSTTPVITALVLSDDDDEDDFFCPSLELEEALALFPGGGGESGDDFDAGDEVDSPFGGEGEFVDDFGAEADACDGGNCLDLDGEDCGVEAIYWFDLVDRGGWSSSCKWGELHPLDLKALYLCIYC